MLCSDRPDGAMRLAAVPPTVAAWKRGLNLETVLRRGRAAEQIARRTSGVVDLLFAGSRGFGLLRRALLDSVSGELVRDAGCPVVITPRSAVVAQREVTTPPRPANA